MDSRGNFHINPTQEEIKAKHMTEVTSFEMALLEQYPPKDRSKELALIRYRQTIHGRKVSVYENKAFREGYEKGREQGEQEKN